MTYESRLRFKVYNNHKKLRNALNIIKPYITALEVITYILIARWTINPFKQRTQITNGPSEPGWTGRRLRCS